MKHVRICCVYKFKRESQEKRLSIQILFVVKLLGECDILGECLWRISIPFSYIFPFIKNYQKLYLKLGSLFS